MPNRRAVTTEAGGVILETQTPPTLTANTDASAVNQTINSADPGLPGTEFGITVVERPVRHFVTFPHDITLDSLWEIPEIPSQASEELEEDHELEGFSYFEKRYKKELFKEKNKVIKEIIEKDPDPVNENEEAIVNYEELADTLASNECKNIAQNESDELYLEKLNYYKELILKHKRKINA